MVKKMSAVRRLEKSLGKFSRRGGRGKHLWRSLTCHRRGRQNGARPYLTMLGMKFQSPRSSPRQHLRHQTASQHRPASPAGLPCPPMRAGGGQVRGLVTPSCALMSGQQSAMVAARHPPSPGARWRRAKTRLWAQRVHTRHAPERDRRPDPRSQSRLCVKQGICAISIH